MIIELFGPPAVGKTTFARELAGRLRGCGRPVELMLSSRPAELIEPGGDGLPKAVPLAALRRVARPAFKLLARASMPELRETSVASQLLDLLPPKSLIWSVRMRQYIKGLERSWRQAEQSDAIVIIDQGFVQAVCSLLLLLGRPVAAGAAERALALIPKADQWIHMDAPRSILRTRLEARRRRQSRIERHLELDIETSLRTAEVLDVVVPMLRRGGACVERVGPGESWTPGDRPAVAAARTVATRADGAGKQTG